MDRPFNVQVGAEVLFDDYRKKIQIPANREMERQISSFSKIQLVVYILLMLRSDWLSCEKRGLFGRTKGLKSSFN